jgi:hypothetical protein
MKMARKTIAGKKRKRKIEATFWDFGAFLIRLLYRY